MRQRSAKKIGNAPIVASGGRPSQAAPAFQALTELSYQYLEVIWRCWQRLNQLVGGAQISDVCRAGMTVLPVAKLQAAERSPEPSQLKGCSGLGAHGPEDLTDTKQMRLRCPDRKALAKEPSGKLLQIAGIKIQVIAMMTSNKDLRESGHGNLRLQTVAGDTLIPGCSFMWSWTTRHAPLPCTEAAPLHISTYST
jgi:hypothetical protein